MILMPLANQVTVSEQLQLSDIATLKEVGVEVLVCNRPDGESGDQVPFETIANAAELAGISAVMMPFSAGSLPPDYPQQFKALLATGKRIHAYCRTGNRSRQLWQAATGASEHSDAQQVQAVAKRHFDVLIVGGGSAGIALSASLRKRVKTLRIGIVEPSAHHYYQPGWTMVGGGIFSAQSTRRNTADLMPAGVQWIQQPAVCLQPDKNTVQLANAEALHYEHLVVACGLKLNWQAIEGLSDTLGRNGVTSNYHYDLAPYTWQLTQQLKHGKALFTQPPMPIKCAGAPQKALYLSADYWLKNGVLNNIGVHFYNAGAVLFGVKEYLPALEHYVNKYQAQLHFQHRLIKVNGAEGVATFELSDDAGNNRYHETEFNMLHVCPPQVAPDFVAQSLLADTSGWLDVNKHTLQHTRFANVWGLGDVTNTPNAKTLAAVRKQVPVVAQNICLAVAGQPCSASYDGYGSCPLTVERGKIVLAEFGYGGTLLPTFPAWLNKGTQPTQFAWWLKAKFLPAFYWRGMLKGHEWYAGPEALHQLE